LGFSLTPPDANGNPGPPRSEIDIDNTDTDTNIRPPANGRLVAWPVGSRGYDVSIQIDSEAADWDTLYQQLREEGKDGLHYPFDDIVFDSNCVAVGSHGGTDLNGGVRFAYDAEYLYAEFVVFDEFFKSYSGNDHYFFLGDSPQLLLDLDLPGDYSNNRNNADDVQLDFYPGSGWAGITRVAMPPQVALWHLGETPQIPILLQQAQVAVRPQTGGGGYILETAVPWSALGITPQPGLEIGIAASISDDDTAVGNDQECMISTSPNRQWQDPTTWGTLLLAPPP
jgi:hypothetical protein